MRHWSLCRVAVFGLAVVFALKDYRASIGQDGIVESDRKIPIAYETDVVVVGGTTGAVSAAIAAAEQGASVFLAAPRPYLGEDVCGTLRMWLHADEKPQSDLERKLFDVKPLLPLTAGRLQSKYEADVPSDPKHGDSNPPSRLTDAQWENASQHSVQYNEHVTITADLGGNKRVKELHLLAFQRNGEFEVADMQVWTSPNGKVWRDLGTVKNPQLDGSSSEQSPIDIKLTIKQPCSHIKIKVRKTENAQRILLAELIINEDLPIAEADVIRQPPTPMQIKYALDEALIDAGVKFLYGSPVTDVLLDSDGRISGIVMANRAGRQAVKAKMVIDATMRASVARIAGAKCKPYPSGPQPFQRIVVGGEPQSDSAMSIKKADIQFVSKEGTHDVFVYSMQLPMKDASFASFSEAEQMARDLTFDVNLVDESDFLFQVPPDPIVSDAPPGGENVDPKRLSLDACKPTGSERLYVLGGCVDVSRAAAVQLLRPLNLMRLGSRIGEAAAGQAAAIVEPKELRVAAAASEASESFIEVREFLQGVRPTDQRRPTVASPERTLPVLGQYDVVVIGGGTGGAPAAIGAARRGSKTLLVEYQDHLGGVGTLGLISSYYHGYRKGFSAEVDEAVTAMGGPKRKGSWNPITKREYWRSEARRSNCDIWFSALGCGTLVSGESVVGVVVATPLGRGAVLAKIVVDATGNADIAAAAGAETVTTSAEHIAMQGTGLSPRALGTGYTNTDYSFSDESDPVDQWRMIVSARRKYRNSYDISTFIDSRERRRIVSDVFITPLDLINGRTYRDTIAMHQSNFDTHGYTVHPIFLINFPDKKQMTVPVPYRALLPKNLDAILVTGLGISAHRDSMPILRMQACIQNQGYAAGVAAAMAAEEGTSPRSIDLHGLQEHLVEIGSLPPDTLNETDSPEPSRDQVAAAVRSVVHDYQGLALILDQPVFALPVLQEAHASANSAEHRVIYANILGMLGDATGSESLIEVIDNAQWDQGWNFRGMGQFGGSISRLDSHIIALGRSGAEDALPTILGKLGQLDASKEFSHHRAVALALETIADPHAAKPLAELLAKEGMTGFSIAQIDSDDNTSANEHRSQPLREIILARALYRCGDYEGAGRQILETYAEDLRGLFAKHAHAVLEADPEVQPRGDFE
ncbi:MAG: FAD-dependent oxidoreductase [Fuerstiella sp.]|nr:FAD-dependent oxidoreductase [Fuerstiella sp.]